MFGSKYNVRGLEVARTLHQQLKLEMDAAFIFVIFMVMIQIKELKLSKFFRASFYAFKERIKI